MSIYFGSMAFAQLTEIGAATSPPSINAAIAFPELEIFVNLEGLIDIEAEKKRLEKDRAKVEGGIKGKLAKLNNEKFVSSAPAEIVQRERESLAQLQEQLKTIIAALEKLSE